VQAPEITYRYIYPKDVAGPTFEIVTRSLALSSAAIPLVINFTGIPKDKILVLTNAAIQANPGATQAVVLIALQGFSSAGAIFEINVDLFVPDADVPRTMNWQGAVYIAGGVEGANNVRLAVDFDAGANANSINLSFTGVVIPRGNAAIF